jgi:hypothetical protein
MVKIKQIKTMLKRVKFIILLLLIIPLNDLSSQTNSWTQELSEDGATVVVYNIYDSLNADGEEKTFIEYTAKTTTTASLKNCITIFNNPGMHKKFYEYTEVSEKIQDISENEWIIYYYYSPPWPIADSDCVSRITKQSDSTNNKIIFTSISEPSLIDKKDVVRSKLNNIKFTFTKFDSEEVEIFIEAKLIPATQAPKWMMNGWFPDGPAGTLGRFKKLAESL